MKILNQRTRGAWLTGILLFAFALCPQAFAETVTNTYDTLNRLTSVVYGSGQVIPLCVMSVIFVGAAFNKVRQSTTRQAGCGIDTAAKILIAAKTAPTARVVEQLRTIHGYPESGLTA